MTKLPKDLTSISSDGYLLLSSRTCRTDSKSQDRSMITAGTNIIEITKPLLHLIHCFWHKLLPTKSWFNSHHKNHFHWVFIINLGKIKGNSSVVIDNIINHKIKKIKKKEEEVIIYNAKRAHL